MRPTVVIVGAGFGGLRAAHLLRGAPVDVILVDRRNYHLFQPLLYQVATAGLEPEQIAKPVRAILRGQANLDFRMTEVTGLDTAAKRVATADGTIAYDYLILAVGGETNYFGLESVLRHGFGLKDIPEAIRIRNHVLHAFERAVLEPDPERRRAELTFVVVGGGPTGVEMAGAIAELAKRALAADFRSIDPRCARIILIEAGPRLLAPFDPALSEAARRSLEQLGVEVRLGASVADCDCSGVSLGRERLQTRTIVWAAGVKASPAAQWLGAENDRAGRVKVQDDLSVPGHPNIFVIGDAAATTGPDGKLLPGVAPVAKQQGQYVAKLLMARAQGRTLRGFRYRDFGAMATIGRKRGVAQVGAFKVSGLAAWLLWSLAHIYFLIGFRNRLAVAINWGWNYVTFQRGTRLITGISGARIEDVMPATTSSLADNTSESSLVQISQAPRRDKISWQKSPQHA